MENKLIYLLEAFQGIKQKRHWSPFFHFTSEFIKDYPSKNTLEIVSTEDLVEILCYCDISIGISGSVVFVSHNILVCLFVDGMDWRRAREWRACHTNTWWRRAEAADKVQLLSSVLVTKGQQSTHGQRSHREVLCTIDCMVTLYIHVLPCWRPDTKPCPEWTPRHRRRSQQQISALCPQQSVNIGLRLRNNIYWCYCEVLKDSSLITTQINPKDFIWCYLFSCCKEP